MACDQGNLCQIGLAVHNYGEAKGSLPPAVTADANGKPLYSWRVLILPYIEQDGLYKEFHLDEPWDSEHNLALLPRMPKIYAPCDRHREFPAFHTYFRVFVGKGTPFEPGRAVRLNRDFPNGAGNTFLIVEAGEPVPWTKPDELVVTDDGPLPPLAGVWPKHFQAIMCNGSYPRFSKPLNEAEIREMIRTR